MSSDPYAFKVLDDFRIEEEKHFKIAKDKWKKASLPTSDLIPLFTCQLRLVHLLNVLCLKMDEREAAEKLRDLRDLPFPLEEGTPMI